MRALDALELDSDADFKAVKAAHRRLAKETHPDAKPGDEEAAKRFKQVQAAYDVLEEGRRAQEREGRARRIRGLEAGAAAVALAAVASPPLGLPRRGMMRSCRRSRLSAIDLAPSPGFAVGRGSCADVEGDASAVEVPFAQHRFAPP